MPRLYSCAASRLHGKTKHAGNGKAFSMNSIATDGQNTEQPTRPAGLPAIDIGGLRVENPLFLAPMAGYTDAAFRSLCLEWGCGGAVTEMVNAHGLTIGHNRTGDFLETWEPVEAGAAIGAQIYGADPARMALAAEKVASLGKFAFIDINAGCPMPDTWISIWLISSSESASDLVYSSVPTRCSTQDNVPLTSSATSSFPPLTISSKPDLSRCLGISKPIQWDGRL